MGARPRNGLSLCSGGGGLDMGIMLAEPQFHTRCFVEWLPEPRAALAAGMRAGYLAPAPIWDDVTTFDGRPFSGAFDTVLAGYPCQPFSMAGQRRGADDERHLWPDVARIIGEIEPRWVILENVAGHITLLDRAICAERCAGYSEPPCWKVDPEAFAASDCCDTDLAKEDTGCRALAAVAMREIVNA